MIVVILFGACLPRSATAPSAYEAPDRSALAVLFACDGYTRSHNYSTRLTGKIEARVFGVPYSQEVSGSRKVGGGVFEEIAESHSAFVSAAIKKEKVKNGFAVSRGKYKRGAFVYGEPEVMNYNAFVSAYGKPATSLCKHELSVVSAECVSPCKYRYVLDNEKSTMYSSNEVVTALGERPVYESVEMLLTVNGDAPAVVVVTEVFRVNKFGGVKCRAEYTEEFVFSA